MDLLKLLDDCGRCEQDMLPEQPSATVNTVGVKQQLPVSVVPGSSKTVGGLVSRVLNSL